MGTQNGARLCGVQDGWQEAGAQVLLINGTAQAAL